MHEEIVFEKFLAEPDKVKANGKISADAEFFRDHFPDFPILPGVLALEIIKKTAEFGLKESSGGRRAGLKAVHAVKFAKYLKPGDKWESEVTLLRRQDETTTWKGKLLRDGEQAVSARLELMLI